MSVTVKLIKVGASGGLLDGAILETIATSVDSSGNLTWEMPNTISGAIASDFPMDVRIDINDGVTNHTGQTFKIYQSTDFTQINDYGSGVQDIRFFNHGESLRISRGITSKPQIYQYINRTFFWDGSAGAVATFDLDTSTPRKLSTDFTETESVYNSGWFFQDGGAHQADFHDLSNKTLYYKCAYVYDGIQEGPLDTFLGDTVGNTNSATIPCITLQIKEVGDHAGFNKRITAINIYRATAYEGPYYKISSVSTLKDDPNILRIDGTTSVSTNTLYPNAGDNVDPIFDHSLDNALMYLKGVTGDYNGKYLLYNALHRIPHGGGSANEPIGGIPSEGVYTDTSEIVAGSNIHKYEHSFGTPDGGYSDDLQYYYDAGLLTLAGKEKASNRENRMWNDPFAIVGSTEHSDNAYGSFTSGSYTNWSGTGTYADSTDHSLVGSTTCKAIHTGASTKYGPVYTISTDTNYWFEVWFKNESVDGGETVTFKINTGSSSTASSNTTTMGTAVSTMQQSTATSDTYTCGNGLSGWERITIKFKSNSSDTKANIEFTSSATITFYLGSLYFGEYFADGEQGFAGSDVIFFTKPTLGNDDSHKGYIFQHGLVGINGVKNGWIIKNTDQAIQFYRSSNYGPSDTFPINDDVPSSTASSLILSNNYQWRDSGDWKLLNIFDKNLIDGTAHPYDETKIDTYYKYSTLSDGRLFAGNVALDPTGANEIHKDWVIFSEVGQFDVLPITNYIQLNDQQGGEITGIETLLGDVVVFMERGVYRINVPSSNPSQWSLVESEENIGCTAPDSIIKSEGNLFFANESDVYFLDTNFNAIPITGPIRDDYQALANANTILHLDQKKDRLLCKFGDETSIIYVFSLKDKGWSKINAGSEKANLFALDENLVTYMLEHEVQTGETDTSFNSLSPTTPVEVTNFVYETGWIAISDIEYNKIIRSLDIRYTAPGGITAYIYTDDDDSAHKWSSGSALSGTNKFSSLRIGVRAKNFKLKISGPQDVSAVEIGRIEVDVDE